MHSHTYMHAPHTCMHTQRHTGIHIYIGTLRHTAIHTHVPTHTNTWAHTYTHRHIQIETHEHSHVSTHTYTHIHTGTHPHTHMCPHIYTGTHTNTHVHIQGAHTHAHKCMQTHIHACTHTHIHTHDFSLWSLTWKPYAQPKTALSQGSKPRGPRLVCGAVGSCGCWGTQTRSFSPLVGFGTRLLWVLLPRSCRACVQGSLLGWDGSRSPCGVRGARPALPEPTRASGSSQFSPTPSAASLRSLTCQVVTPQLVGGGGGQVCQTLRRGLVGLENPQPLLLVHPCLWPVFRSHLEDIMYIVN